MDIFRLPSDILPLLVQDNLIAPIDDFLTADDKGDIYPSLLDSVRMKGKAYRGRSGCRPSACTSISTSSRRRASIRRRADWTYDQFVDIAKKLTFHRANGDKVYGYTGGIDPGLVNTWPFILDDGALPLSADNTKYTFNTPEGISGLQKARRPGE